MTQLDVITPFPLPANTPNYTAYDISPGLNFWNIGKYCVYMLFRVSVLKLLFAILVITELNLPGTFDLHDMSFWTTKEMLRLVGTSTTEYALKHPNVKELLYGEKKHHYDLILTEQFFQDAFLMFGQKFKAPIVSICKCMFFIVK